MASFKVVTKGFARIAAVPGKAAERARQLPRAWRLETNERFAVINFFGGRQTVTRPMQGAIAGKIGPGASPPKVGTVMIHLRRPVRVTKAMLSRSAPAVARHVLRGGPVGVEPVMREEVQVQFSRGGIPSWPASRNWGDLTAARPTLGGTAGPAAAGWRGGRFVEVR